MRRITPAWRGGGVVLVEIAPAQDGNFEDAQIAWRDAYPSAAKPVSLRRPAHDLEWQAIVNLNGKPVRGGRNLNPGYRVQQVAALLR